MKTANIFNYRLMNDAHDDCLAETAAANKY